MLVFTIHLKTAISLEMLYFLLLHS